MKLNWILITIGLLLAAGVRAESHDVQTGKPVLDVKDADRQLPGTRIVPTLDASHEAGKNLLYCATTQLAWNELMDMLNGPVNLEGDPPAAEKLNRKDFTKKMLDESSYFVFAGEGGKAPERLGKELSKKFAGAASPKLIPEKLGDNDFITYSYLFKNLEFNVLLHPYPDGFKFSDGVVGSFGVGLKNEGRDKMSRVVQVHDYINTDSFVIELLHKTPGDRLFVAEIPPAVTLQESVEAVLKRLNKTDRIRLEWGEDLRVPVLNFEIVKTYRDLAPRALRMKNMPMDARLLESLQLIRLKLDERGSVLKSEARIVGTKRSVISIDDDPPPPPPRRHFICNKPFLVMMIRNGQSKPYFALWIENLELLVKSDAPPGTDPPAVDAPASTQPAQQRTKHTNRENAIDD